MTWDLAQEEQDGQCAGRELTPGSAQRISCHVLWSATHAYGYQQCKQHPEAGKIQERQAQLHGGKLQHRMCLQPGAQGRDQARKEQQARQEHIGGRSQPERVPLRVSCSPLVCDCPRMRCAAGHQCPHATQQGERERTGKEPHELNAHRAAEQPRSTRGRTPLAGGRKS